MKGVKKVFRKVVDVVKKVAPYVIMAAAIYFTAGLALAAFPATSAAAAAMPGIGALTGAAGGAAASSATLAAVPTYADAAGGLGLVSTNAAGVAASLGGGATAVSAIASAAAGGLQALPAFTAAGTAAGSAGPIVSALTKIGQVGHTLLSGTSMTEKLMLASMGTQAISAFVGPTSKEIARDQAIENAKFRGAYYGMEADGSTAPKPPDTDVQLKPPGGRDLFANTRTSEPDRDGGSQGDLMPSVQAPMLNATQQNSMQSNLTQQNPMHGAGTQAYQDLFKRTETKDLFKPPELSHA